MSDSEILACSLMLTQEREMFSCVVCAADKCEREFPDAVGLREHVSLDHLRLLPYACLHCDSAKSAVPALLRPHFQRAHPDRLFQLLYTPQDDKEAQLQQLLRQCSQPDQPPARLPPLKPPANPQPQMPPFWPPFMTPHGGLPFPGMATPFHPPMPARFLPPQHQRSPSVRSAASNSSSNPTPHSNNSSNHSTPQPHHSAVPPVRQRARKSIAAPKAPKIDPAEEEEEEEEEVVQLSSPEGESVMEESSEVESELPSLQQTCGKCGLKLSGADVTARDATLRRHVWESHINTRTIISCPVSGCPFARKFDMPAVRNHIRVVHPNHPYRQPIDKRHYYETTVDKLLKECFPALSIHPNPPDQPDSSTEESSSSPASVVTSPPDRPSSIECG